MARILFSTIGFGIKELYCYYDQFTKALSDAGNEVLVMTSDGIIKNGWSSNKHYSNVKEGKLNNFIRDFNPDLVIAANNVLYRNIQKIVDCPIVIFGADKAIGFADKQQIKANVDRYYFIYETPDCGKQIEDLFNPKSSRMIMMPTATNIRAEDVQQDANISFIGTNFNFNDKIKRYFLSINDEKIVNDFGKFYDSYRKNSRGGVENTLKELGFNADMLGKVGDSDFLNIISGNRRLQTLAAVADLGLELYGHDSWADVASYSFELMLSYKKKKIVTAQQNQDLYNRSKLAINLSHEQALDNFSWRVRDIMASNACLVSDYRKNLDVYFGKYVKIPTFTNPFEARDLCQKLLKDDSWRSDIVKGCQMAIEEEHRFCYRIKDMEQALGVKLIDSEKNGSIKFFDFKDFVFESNFGNKLSFLGSKNSPLKAVNRARINVGRITKRKKMMKVIKK